MFHTPPIDSSFKDESTKESYSDPLHTIINQQTADNDNEDNDNDDEGLPQELPPQLNELITIFLKDLKTPKYNKPLTPEQLYSTFQTFYKKFHQRAELFVKGSVYYKKRITRIELQTRNEIASDKRFNKTIELKIRRYIEIAEEQICIELFEKLFNKFPKDIKINSYLIEKLAIIKKIKGIDYNVLLDIAKIEFDQPIIKEISHKFNELNHFTTPCSKLKVLISIHSSINQFLKTQLSNEFVDGDYFLPLLIYLILINENDVDFYSNFIYIKRFRQDSLLVGESLYCLTNFEAAITFIQHLELLNDGFDYSNLTQHELDFLKMKLSLEIDESIDIHIPSDGHILSNSTDGIKLISSAIDSSFKSMMHRFGSSSIVPTQTNELIDEVEPSNDGYNPINKLVGVMKWRSNTPIPPDNGTVTNRSRSNTLNRSRSSTLNSTPVDIHKFKNRKFKDLKISELEELFNDYSTLTKWLDK